jgi:hypothetical protein
MVSFRLTEEEHSLLAAKATQSGTKPSVFARDLVLQGLHANVPPKGSPTEITLEKLGARIARAVIIALSPEMDEAATDGYLAEVYFGSASVGGPYK